MTFASEVDNVGRIPGYVVEIDLDKCALAYGVGLCTANGAAGTECYNSQGTCQDKDNFDGSGTLTLRFSMAGQAPVMGQNVAPAVTRVSIAPTKLAPGKGLSSRSKVDIELIDFTDADLLTDPYADTRNYIATDQGTFFGKLFARNPHYIGRPLRVKLGYFPSDGSVADLTDFDRTYNYVIDRIDGPDAKGKVKIVGKDILSLADGLKVKVPEASEGTLVSAITTTAQTTSWQVDDVSNYDTGAGYIRVGDEIVSYTSMDASGNFSGISRAQAGTTAATYSAGDSVQQCVEVGFTATGRVDTVVYVLLNTYAGIDASFLETTVWDAEADTWLSNYNLKNMLSVPTELDKLLNQICIECGVDIWWSDTDQVVKFKAQVPDTTGSQGTISDNVMLRDRASVEHKVKDRLSQVYFYTAKKDYAGDDDKVGNYSNVVVRVDASSEGADEYNNKGVRKVFCQWVQTTALAGQQATRLLNRYVKPPVTFKAELDIAETDRETGDLILLDSALCQDVDGSNKTVEMQMLSTQMDPDRQTIKVEALTFLSAVGRSAFIAATGAPDPYTTATGDANPTWSWIAETGTGQMANGDDAYLII